MLTLPTSLCPLNDMQLQTSCSKQTSVPTSCLDSKNLSTTRPLDSQRTSMWRNKCICLDLISGHKISSKHKWTQRKGFDEIYRFHWNWKVLREIFCPTLWLPMLQGIWSSDKTQHWELHFMLAILTLNVDHFLTLLLSYWHRDSWIFGKVFLRFEHCWRH
jgi:hypothetical protein